MQANNLIPNPVMYNNRHKQPGLSHEMSYHNAYTQLYVKYK